MLGLSEDEVSSFKETELGELGSLIFRVDPFKFPSHCSSLSGMPHDNGWGNKEPGV